MLQDYALSRLSQSGHRSSEMLHLRSRPQVAIRVPVGDHATDFTSFSWPSRVATSSQAAFCPHFRTGQDLDQCYMTRLLTAAFKHGCSAQMPCALPCTFAHDPRWRGMALAPEVLWRCRTQHVDISSAWHLTSTRQMAVEASKLAVAR